MNASAEFNTNNWSNICVGEDKKQCSIGIKKSIKQNNSNKTQDLASVTIIIGQSKKKVMGLVSKEDQTYKLGEETENIPLLVVTVPFNSDLRKKILVRADDKNIANLNYLFCNNGIGCKAMTVVNNKVIDLLKAGKEVSLIFPVFGSNQNVILTFPLKGFTKSYKELSNT